MSVDFTLFANFEPSTFEGTPPDSEAEEADEREPIHFVPLTLLRKQPLTRVSVRDESDRAVPLLTRHRNSGLAVAALCALAEQTTGERLATIAGQQPPVEIEHDLWQIAESRASTAIAVWRRLGRPSGPSPEEKRWREELVRNEQFMALASDLARHFLLVVPLVGPPGKRRILKFSYEQYGDRPQLVLPAWLAWMRDQWLTVAWRRSPGSMDAAGHSREKLPLGRWAQRAIGWRPRSIAIEAPSVAQAASYHLEVAAPEGLEVTRARLQSVDPYDLRVERSHELRETRQRAHLYLANVRQGSSGGAVITLRPTPEYLLRTAWLSAAFTLVVLAAVSVRWRAMVGNLGTVPGLLLVVPAALSAYVARAREPTVTTSVLFGLRMLAASAGLWSFTAAVVLVAGRSCESGSGGATLCHSWGATPYALWVLVLLAAATFAILSVTLTLVANPPEQGVRPPSGQGQGGALQRAPAIPDSVRRPRGGMS